MAYDDWPEEFQEVWDTLERSDAFEGMSSDQLEYTEYMFEEGWMTYEDEKLHPSDIEFARNEFWDSVGLEYEGEFDWEGWREAMGYDLCPVVAVAVSALKRSIVTGLKPGCGRPLSVPLTPLKSEQYNRSTKKTTGYTLTRHADSATVPEWN